MSQPDEPPPEFLTDEELQLFKFLGLHTPWVRERGITRDMLADQTGIDASDVDRLAEMLARRGLVEPAYRLTSKGADWAQILTGAWIPRPSAK